TDLVVQRVLAHQVAGELDTMITTPLPHRLEIALQKHPQHTAPVLMADTLVVPDWPEQRRQVLHQVIAPLPGEHLRQVPRPGEQWRAEVWFIHPDRLNGAP